MAVSILSVTRRGGCAGRGAEISAIIDDHTQGVNRKATTTATGRHVWDGGAVRDRLRWKSSRALHTPLVERSRYAMVPCNPPAIAGTRTHARTHARIQSNLRAPHGF